MKILLLSLLLLPAAAWGQAPDPLVLKLPNGATIHFDNMQMRRKYEVEHPSPTPVAPVSPADLTTRDGHVYKNAKATRIEPDGVTYIFAGGVAKIPFIDLPESVRKQYGYDPKRSADFAA